MQKKVCDVLLSKEKETTSSQHVMMSFMFLDTSTHPTQPDLILAAYAEVRNHKRGFQSHQSLLQYETLALRLPSVAAQSVSMCVTCLGGRGRGRDRGRCRSLANR